MGFSSAVRERQLTKEDVRSKLRHMKARTRPPVRRYRTFVRIPVTGYEGDSIGDRSGLLTEDPMLVAAVHGTQLGLFSP